MLLVFPLFKTSPLFSSISFGFNFICAYEICTYSSSIRVTEILLDHVGLSSNRNSLYGFRTFCTGQGVCVHLTSLFIWLLNVIPLLCQSIYILCNLHAEQCPGSLFIITAPFWGHYSILFHIGLLLISKFRE